MDAFGCRGGVWMCLYISLKVLTHDGISTKQDITVRGIESIELAIVLVWNAAHSNTRSLESKGDRI